MGANFTMFFLNNRKMIEDMTSTETEFKIGDTVTLDRYNHISDRVRVKVIGYGTMPVSGTLTYKMDVNGVIIESTGKSIMESKLYEPVQDHERHH